MGSMTGDAATLTTLAQKLRHPLGRIRARALANLLFKLRARLVDVAAAPRRAVEELMAALVGCLADEELEASTLQVLQLLMDDERDASVCAPALRAHGAAAAFQRGGMDSNRHGTYEELLHRLLAMSSAVQEQLMAPTVVSDVPAVTQARDTMPASLPVAPTRQAGPKSNASDPLTSHGWRFPRVALAAVDEQFLFEFEVKWRLRTSVPEIVELCDIFRRDLLRDFPPEVFLQRPAMLLRVLELARQPLVPVASTPELSFGVSYFDEPSSRVSFTWKPSVHATALHVSALKALESWLSALRHSMRVSLNPIYHSFPTPSTSANISVVTNTFGRFYYPQTTQNEEAIGSEDEVGLSLGGSAYLVVSTLLRLLSSPSYPHLHLLNVAHAATHFLNERSIPADCSSVNSLDKQRIESLFAILLDAVRLERTLDTLVSMCMLDWLFLVLRVFSASAFRVGDDVNVEKIMISPALWTWILQQLAFQCDADKYSEKVELLNQIEPSVSTLLAKISESGKDTTQLVAALQGESIETSLKLSSKIISVVSILTEQHRSIGSDFVLRSLTSELEKTSEEPTVLVNEVLLGIMRLASQEESSLYSVFGRRILDGLIDWIVKNSSVSQATQRVQVIIAAVSGEFVHIMLSALAANRSDKPSAETLWRLGELLLRGYENLLGGPGSTLSVKVFSRSMPILQHLAYFDSNVVPTASFHQRLQRTFVRLAHQIEPSLKNQDQLLLISRCLLHRSVFIRKAASSGLLDRLNQLNSVLVERVPRTALTTIDPFGLFMEDSGENRRRILENEMLALLQPPVPTREGGQTPTGSAGNGSILHRISRLRKLLSSLSISTDPQSATFSAAESTLQQLLIDLVYSTSADFNLFEDAGELEELTSLCVRLLSPNEEPPVPWQRDLRGHLLGVFRVLLLRSVKWRQTIREDTKLLSTLLSFVFDEAAQVRAEMYFVLLTLTCSVDSVLHISTLSGLVVPSEFADTFGLFSARWPFCGISVQAIGEWLHSLSPPTSSATGALFDILHGPTPIKMSPQSSVQVVWENLEAAKSFRTFLDSIYHTIHACHAVAVTRSWISSHWDQANFLHYLRTPPTSAKDQVVVAAVLSLVNVMFDSLSTNQQMELVFLLRQNIIPLQLSTERQHFRTSSLSREIVRLLLRLGTSEVANMFVPLVTESGLVKKLGQNINATSLGANAAPLDRHLWIELTRTALRETPLRSNKTDPAKDSFCDAILLPLQAIAGRHRVPGSFQDRASVIVAVSCLRKLSSPDADAHCHTRLIFDSSATLRSTGFRFAASSVGADDSEVNSRILRLAADTFREESESDGVRSAALDLISQFLTEAPKDYLQTSLPFIDGDRFLPQLISDFESRTSRAGQCNVLLNLSTVRLLRLLASHREKFSPFSLGNVLKILRSNEEEDFRTLRAIIELLSLSRALVSYKDHNAKQLHTPATEGGIWRQSLVPVVLQTISETAKLLHSLLLQSPTQASSIASATPLTLQLVETIIDISKSVQQFSQGDKTTPELLHFEAIDHTVQLLTLLLASRGTAPVPKDRLNQFVSAITVLLSPPQPSHFRYSVARIIPAIVCGSHKEFLDVVAEPDYTSSLGSSLWMSYKELCDTQRMDLSLSTSLKATWVPHFRRVAFALQALVSTLPDVSTPLCGERNRAVVYVVQSMKLGFAAIRMAGGFGAKTSTDRDEAFCLELCHMIQLHCQVLSSFMASSVIARNTARIEQLPRVVANNWTIMRAARQRGSLVFVAALRLVQNFIHADDANKTALATTVASTGQLASSDSERNLLAMIGDVALGGPIKSPFDEITVSVAAAVLKSAFLQLECLHNSIRSGLVTKLFASVFDRSKRRRLSSKGLTPPEERSLVELVGVLASVATIDEGRQVVLQVRDLKNFLDDIFHFPEGSDLFVAGALFVRNMAFSKVSKSHVSVWEPVLDAIIAFLHRSAVEIGSNKSRMLVAANYLSTALLCFIHDNQRAQSVIQSSRKSLELIHDARRTWSQSANSTSNDQARQASAVKANLDRAQTLLESDNVAERRP